MTKFKECVQSFLLKTNNALNQNDAMLSFSKLLLSKMTKIEKEIV